MNRLLYIVSQALSVILYPLWMPTYGMALFCYSYAMHVQSITPLWAAIAIGGTFLLTGLLPLIIILILIRKGEVSGIQIENAAERRLPYFFATLGFCFWAYFLINILHSPMYINVVAVGATIALCIVSLINRKWKISAHLTGWGGLMGGLFSYCLGIGAFPTWGTLAVWCGLTLVLMSARLYLNAHTPAQVVAGWLLGIGCTFIPSLIIQHVL